MMRLPFGLLLCGAILLAGCAGSSPQERARSRHAPKSEEKPAEAEPAKKVAGEKAAPRKIVYIGRVELVVEDFGTAEGQLTALLAEHDGYVAHTEVTGRPGEPRFGHWTLRVPVAKFERLRQALSKLGELRKSTLESDDITDRYFDMAAEVTNLEAREKALRKLFDDKIAGTKLADLLEVDRELSKVRGEINQRKGQLQRWDKETEFATLHVEIVDRKGYVPPTSPDFGTSIERTFYGSIDMLLRTAQGLTLGVVAIAPWGAILLALALPYLLLRRWRKRQSAPPSGGSETTAGPAG